MRALVRIVIASGAALSSGALLAACPDLSSLDGTPAASSAEGGAVLPDGAITLPEEDDGPSDLVDPDAATSLGCNLADLGPNPLGLVATSTFVAWTRADKAGRSIRTVPIQGGPGHDLTAVEKDNDPLDEAGLQGRLTADTEAIYGWTDYDNGGKPIRCTETTCAQHPSSDFGSATSIAFGTTALYAWVPSSAVDDAGTGPCLRSFNFFDKNAPNITCRTAGSASLVAADVPCWIQTVDNSVRCGASGTVVGSTVTPSFALGGGKVFFRRVSGRDSYIFVNVTGVGTAKEWYLANPTRLAADATNVYWVEAGKLYRRAIDAASGDRPKILAENVSDEIAISPLRSGPIHYISRDGELCAVAK